MPRTHKFGGVGSSKPRSARVEPRTSPPTQPRTSPPRTSPPTPPRTSPSRTSPRTPTKESLIDKINKRFHSKKDFITHGIQKANELRETFSGSKFERAQRWKELNVVRFAGFHGDSFHNVPEETQMDYWKNEHPEHLSYLFSEAFRFIALKRGGEYTSSVYVDPNKIYRITGESFISFNPTDLENMAFHLSVAKTEDYHKSIDDEKINFIAWALQFGPVPMDFGILDYIDEHSRLKDKYDNIYSDEPPFMWYVINRIIEYPLKKGEYVYVWKGDRIYIKKINSLNDFDRPITRQLSIPSDSSDDDSRGGRARQPPNRLMQIQMEQDETRREETPELSDLRSSEEIREDLTRMLTEIIEERRDQEGWREIDIQDPEIQTAITTVSRRTRDNSFGSIRHWRRVARSRKKWSHNAVNMFFGMYRLKNKRR